MTKPELQFDFKLTPRESRRLRELNGIDSGAGWSSLLIGVLCLLPTAGLLALALPHVGSAVGSLLLLFFAALIWYRIRKATRKPLDLPIRIELTERSRTEHEGHSCCETIWEFPDEFIDDEQFFLYRRLSRYAGIPKRVIPPEQLDRVLELSRRTFDPPPVGSPPIRLFEELFGGAGFGSVSSEAIEDAENLLEPVPAEAVLATVVEPRQAQAGRSLSQNSPNTLPVSPINQSTRGVLSTPIALTFEARDLGDAARTRLRVVDFGDDVVNPRGAQYSTPRRSSWRVSIIFFVAAILLLMISQTGQARPLAVRFQWYELVCFAGAMIAPLFTFKLWFWVLRKQAAAKHTEVPRDEYLLLLAREGWAVGTPQNVSFFDWRDVTIIFQNEACFGIQVNHGLVQIIPKRIFQSPSEQNSFIEAALHLRREHLQKFAKASSAVETGNPFQAPVG